jgi:hypothetical protein
MDVTPNTAGVQETKEVLSLVRAAYQSASDLLGSGEKVSAFKLIGLALPLNKSIVAAFDGIKGAKAELANLSQNEFEAQLGPELLAIAYLLYKDFVAEVK